MRKILQYVLPVTFTLFMCLTVERTVITDGGYDRLFGLLLPYISNNAGCSGCYEVYVLAIMVNLLFFFAFAMGLVMAIERVGTRLRTHKLLVGVGLAVSLFWISLFVLTTLDSRFLLTNHTEYKTTKRELKAGPWWFWKL